MKTKEQLNASLEAIFQKIEDWEEDLKLDGKNIQSAIVEQPSLVAYYDQISVDASYVVDYMEMQLKKVRAERIKFIKENFAKDYTDTAINRVVEGDKEYNKTYALLLEARSVHDRCKAIVDAFRQRAYCLNNLVKIYENELHNITIRL